jgi:hypothetical protein
VRSSRSREAGVIPPRFLRFVFGGVFGLATLVAVLFTMGGGPRLPLLIVATFWGVLGIVSAIFDAIDRVPDALSSLLANVGLMRHPPGFSQIEALVAQGHYEAAAESYRMRARREAERVEATVRRAWLLAGPLGAAAQAVAELKALREPGDLSPAEDVRVGLALADLQDDRRESSGEALKELRRLLDRYPDSPYAREVRMRLEHLRRDHFPEASA